MRTPNFVNGWTNIPLIRAHLCTLAVSVSINATWRLPRDAFRYGGLTYGLALTVALVLVALPITILQLAIGQLSQQDTVGVWRAVPFFKGVGYLKILVSFLGSAYTSIYLSLSIAYFLYAASKSIPFPECIDFADPVEGYFEIPVSFDVPFNASECLSLTFMSAVGAGPEYYLATAFVIVVLWITTPIIFYDPVKWKKRIFYVLGPITLVLGIATVSSIGDAVNLSTFVHKSDWRHCLDSRIWLAAIVQALWSCQIAGGYLTSAGDSVYSNTNVQWTSLAVVGASLVSSWFWLLFWFAVGGTSGKDTSALAVLLQTYQVTVDGNINITWALILYAIVILSGVIGMLTMIYPICALLRRVGGVKWRYALLACSLAGAPVSVAILAGRTPALTILDDIAVPLLICIATALEIFAFGFIYGWKTLIEDVEFLIENEVPKYWLWGWWLSPAIIVPSFVWWVTDIFRRDSDWSDPSWEAATVVTAASVAVIVLALSAVAAVIRQVQYDCITKLKSSFQPSRHWGPRDPITHYYWLAGRDGAARGDHPRNRYRRRELGQLSRRPSLLTVSEFIQTKDKITPDVKKRSNSDDWVYTTGRKEVLAQLYSDVDCRKRSKSLDWEVIIKLKSSDIIRLNGDNSIVTRY